MWESNLNIRFWRLQTVPAPTYQDVPRTGTAWRVKVNKNVLMSSKYLSIIHIINPFSAGTVYIRQNITIWTSDVDVWRPSPQWKSRTFDNGCRTIVYNTNHANRYSNEAKRLRHLWWFQIEINPLFSTVHTKIPQCCKFQRSEPPYYRPVCI